MWASRRSSSWVSTISGTQPPKNLDTNMPALKVGEKKDKVTAQFLRETSSHFHNSSCSGRWLSRERLPTKPDDLSSIPGINTVEEELTQVARSCSLQCVNGTQRTNSAYMSKNQNTSFLWHPWVLKLEVKLKSYFLLPLLRM